MKLRVAGSILTLALAGGAGAATHTWKGAASGGVWSSSGNWMGGLPTSNEAGGTIVAFNSGVSSTQDIAGLIVDRIMFSGTGNTIHGPTALTIRGTVLSPAIWDLAGGNTLANDMNITLSGTVANPVDVLVSAGTLTIIAASMSGSAGGLTFTGNVNLLSYDTYSGTTTVKSGLLNLNSAITNGSIPGALVIGDGMGAPGSAIARELSDSNIANTSVISIASDGVLDLNDFSDTVAGLTDVTAGVSGSVALGSTGFLTLQQPNSSNLVFDGSFTGSGQISVKGNGSALQDFHGTSTTTALTTVPAGGVLAIDGSQTSSIFSVTGKLTGSGSTGNLNAFSTSTINPGVLTTASVGTLHSNTTSLQSGSTFQVLLLAGMPTPQNDALAATGNVTLAGALVVELGYTPVAGDTFTILTTTGTLSGTFTGLPNGSTFMVSSTTLSIQYTTNSVVLSVCDATAPVVTPPASSTVTQSVCQ